MARLFSTLVAILIISGFPESSLGYDDSFYYEDYYNEPNENVPKAIIGQQARGNCSLMPSLEFLNGFELFSYFLFTMFIIIIFQDIENTTQTTVIRMIERENRIMSQKMDEATERCLKEVAVFENACKRCTGRGSVLPKVLQHVKKLMKLHPLYLNIKLGKKVLKTLKRVPIRKIVQKLGKSIGKLAKNIGNAWRGLKKGIKNVGRRLGNKVRRIGRRVVGAVRGVGRKIRRLVRARVRLPRIRVRGAVRRVGRKIRRLVRARVRLPRIRVRVRRVLRFRRRWRGKKRKRSSCEECERVSKMKDDDQTNASKSSIHGISFKKYTLNIQRRK
jgi:hypothetical protein